MSDSNTANSNTGDSVMNSFITAMETLTKVAFFAVSVTLAVFIFFGLLIASNLLGQMALTAFGGGYHG